MTFLLIRPLVLFALLAFVTPFARSADPATPIDFTLASGTYFAAVASPNGGAPEQRFFGSVRVSVGANRSATGLLRIMGKSLPIKLEFDAVGHVSATVQLGDRTATLTFDLVITSNGPVLAGSIGVGTNELEFNGFRAATSANGGRYLFYVKTDGAPATVPGFIGSGAIDISAKGGARVIARLLLGGAVTQGTRLLENGSVMLDLVTSSRSGILAGGFSLDFVEGPYLFAPVAYFQAPDSNRAQYPEGVDYRVDLLATAHRVQRPPIVSGGPGNPVALLLEGGDLESTAFIQARMLPTGLVLPPATWRYSIGYVDPITGFVRGVFAHPDTGRRLIFHGVIDHARSEVQAGFLDATKAGSLRIVSSDVE